MSKGDKPRPMSVSYDEYGRKWDKIFGDKCTKSHVPNEETLKSMENTEKGIGLTLLNDNTLDAEIEKMKTSHA